MKKLYILQYETRENSLNALIVADPDKKLANGNYKIISTFFGAGADQLINELTLKDKRDLGRWIRSKLDKTHYKYTCYNCGYSERYRAPVYCANCGRRMSIEEVNK